MEEKDVIRYLKRSKDNIIVVFGQKIYCLKRSQVKEDSNDPSFCYTGEDGKRYHQILGRPLIAKEQLTKIASSSYSIFDLSVLLNVIRVFSDSDPGHIHNRSIYKIDAYSATDYEKTFH